MKNTDTDDLWGQLDDQQSPDAAQPRHDTADDQEAIQGLQRALFAIYQHQPRAAMAPGEGRQKAALLRAQCGKLGFTCPKWLRDWHPDVEAIPDPTLGVRFVYHDPDDSPNPPLPYPEVEPLPEGAGDDLDRWERKAVKAAKSGKSPMVSFSSDTIPPEILKFVATGLREAHSISDVRAVFDELGAD